MDTNEDINEAKKALKKAIQKAWLDYKAETRPEGKYSESLADVAAAFESGWIEGYGASLRSMESAMTEGKKDEP